MRSFAVALVHLIGFLEKGGGTQSLSMSPTQVNDVHANRKCNGQSLIKNLFEGGFYV